MTSPEVHTDKELQFTVHTYSSPEAQGALGSANATSLKHIILKKRAALQVGVCASRSRSRSERRSLTRAFSRRVTGGVRAVRARVRQHHLRGGMGDASSGKFRSNVLTGERLGA